MENQTIAIDPYEYEIIELIDGDDDADNGISYSRSLIHHHLKDVVHRG